MIYETPCTLTENLHHMLICNYIILTSYMKSEHIVDSYYTFTSKYRDNRVLINAVRYFLRGVRRLRVPLYKKIYDQTIFQSYFFVLQSAMELTKGGNYFEWGPGRNTRLAEKMMKHVSSVEHDDYWFNMYKEFDNEKTHLILSPINKDGYLEYPREILKTKKKLGESIDLAFVDARCRVECVQHAANAGVPLVVMHDSLHPDTFTPSKDGAPPVSNNDRPYYEGYSSYRYFIEVIDLRTIVLMNSSENFNSMKEKLQKFFTRSGETKEYITIVAMSA
jgi:hypothetical protein